MKSSQDTTPPTGVTTPSDVIRWHTSLQMVHARLACHFARPEPFARALRFVQGILSTVERKNGWQLAEQAREATPYGMQRLLSQAVWDVDGVRDDIRAFALHQVGSKPLIVAIDETGFLKRGKHSAGVGTQHYGPTGDRRNCQVGVFLSLVTQAGHTLIDRELYLPGFLDRRSGARSSSWNPCHGPVPYQAAVGHPHVATPEAGSGVDRVGGG